MCHAAQEAGAPHRGYIDRKKENVIFTPSYLGDLEPNLLQSCPPARGVYIPNLKEITPAISEIRAAKVSIFFFVVHVFAPSLFRTLAKIAIKRKRVLRSP